MTRPCELRRLHLVTYENGMRMQETLVALRQKELIRDQLLLLEHPPVITLGRGGDTANLLASEESLAAHGIRFYETTRGGDITYHGPGQLVGYPLIHLGEGSRDVRKYVTRVEEVLIRTLRHFGIESTREDGKRGVWAGREKVAAIGVRIARWVTSHGFALNVDPDLDHFRMITPCGLHGTGVTSISRLLGRKVSIDEVVPVLTRHFQDVFDLVLETPEAPMRIVKVLAHDHAGRILLLHRPRGDFWQPITGRVENGESDQQCAVRELHEETGWRLLPSPMGLVQSFTIDPKFVGREELPFLFVDEVSFSVEADSASAVALDQEEHDAHEWFTIPESLERIVWSNDRQSLELLRFHLSQRRG